MYIYFLVFAVSSTILRPTLTNANGEKHSIFLTRYKSIKLIILDYTLQQISL